jgi:Fic family protein
MNKDFIPDIHKTLMNGKARKQSKEVGTFRTKQNYIGKVGGPHETTYTPPVFEKVPELIENLISYMLKPNYSIASACPRRYYSRAL